MPLEINTFMKKEWWESEWYMRWEELAKKDYRARYRIS